MIKILLGGSPCTFWSIAQKNNRETKAEGLGWELFKNYLIAKEKFKPDFFLYENNASVAGDIKEQIETELGVSRMEINSALVSAQTRKRFYCFNWTVCQPENREILLKDVLGVGDNGNELCRNAALRVGLMPQSNGAVKDSQGNRIYSVNGKSVTQSANGGGWGAKTGLYAIPATKSGPNVYEVSNGTACINGVQCQLKLKDGLYEIRKLKPLESERLQTMPDNYTEGVSDTQRQKALGNGWTAEVIIHILQGALKDVPKDEEIVVLSMYDGIGTGRYCLDKMGFTNVKYFAYEIDKYAKEIAMKNYPDIIQMGDAFQLRHPDWTIGY